MTRDVLGLVIIGGGFALGPFSPFWEFGAMKLFSMNELIRAFLIGKRADDLLPYSLMNCFRLYKKFSSLRILSPSSKIF